MFGTPGPPRYHEVRSETPIPAEERERFERLINITIAEFFRRLNEEIARDGLKLLERGYEGEDEQPLHLPVKALRGQVFGQISYLAR